MPAGMNDGRYSYCRYSMMGSLEGATVSIRSCAEDPSDEETSFCWFRVFLIVYACCDCFVCGLCALLELRHCLIQADQWKSRQSREMGISWGTAGNLPKVVEMPESQCVCGGLRNTHLFWNTVHNGPSRSSKVDFGTNRKCVCDFLLVINSNLGPILPRFRDIAGFLRRATPPLFHPAYFELSSGEHWEFDSAGILVCLMIRRIWF